MDIREQEAEEAGYERPEPMEEDEKSNIEIRLNHFSRVSNKKRMKEKLQYLATAFGFTVYRLTFTIYSLSS